MALLGSLIKTALDLTVPFQQPPANPRAAQERQLRQLLETAQHTAFGVYYNFAGILDEDDPVAAFRRTVPLHDYDTLHQEWWARQQDAPDITWPGRPHYFALSSGTTGKESKRIPVTDAMLDCFRSVGRSQIASLAHFDLPPDFFEKDVLMLSSSADLTPYKNHLEGEISGINSGNIPDWFQGFYKPGRKIAAIDDWDERVAAIAKAAPEWDVVALAGIPSWIRMMLIEIIKTHRLDNIHELWPNLSLYASGGVAFGPHRKSFAPLLARPLTIVDTYLASEGFFAFTARPGTMNMQLAAEHGIYYEFIPFDERGFDGQGQLLPEPLVLGLHEVEPERDYALVVSTPAGAWRYLIGDTIKFKDLGRHELVISGRTKYFLNVVGSQLSEEKLNAAVDALASDPGLNVNEFSVAAVRDEESGEYVHQWVLGLDGEIGGLASGLTSEVAKPESVAARLDDHLQEVNKNYRVARQKALRGVRVRLVASNRIYAWLEQHKKKGGQIKVPKVMSAKKMGDLLDFLNQYPSPTLPQDTPHATTT